MSLRKVSAGNGYEYLLRSVARNDEDQRPTKLSDYYAAKGTPPGRWIGAGLSCFGSISAGDEITDEQMWALYGEGLHPDADAMIADGASYEQIKIGRPFAIYTGGDEVLEAIREAEKAFKRDSGRLPTKRERSDLAAEIAIPAFIAETGVEPESQREVLNWVNAKQARVRQAVAGYDFTFSPQKSVSVLWALADEETAAKIAELHHRAVSETLAWANENVVFSRRGAGGIEQIKTKGMIAAEFTHFDTRAGDPDLHSHVVVSNKAQGEDGVWRSLDGQAIFQQHHVLDFRYTATLTDLLSREMGLSFHAQSRGETKEAVYELDCVPDDVSELFTKRQQLARPVYERLVAEYVDQFGYSPSYQTTRALWQKAILETRNAKQPAKSLAELRDEWRAEVMENLPHAEALFARLEHAVEFPDGDRRPLYMPESHDEMIIGEAVETVSRRRATFKRSHVLTAVLAKLNAYTLEEGQLETVSQRLTDQILDNVGINLNPDDGVSLPDALRRSDGKAIDYRDNSEQFTTQAILDAEQVALDAVTTPVAVFVSESTIDDALAAHEEEHGWALNSQQAELVNHLANAGTLAATGVGAAGTGKTASMQVLTNVWHSQGRNVIAVAPSAAAATVLGDDIGVSGRTIDSLTRAWRKRNAIEDLPVAISRGDMILVDEAGMSSTENLASLTEIAQATGAVVRLIGDHKQLDAVETGGLFGTMTTVANTVQLTNVQRFGDDSEQAEASLKLRDGNTSAIDVYENRGWIHNGARHHILDTAVADYLADEKAGRKSLIIASTNADVDQLNTAIQADRIARGVVVLDRTTTLARGEQAGIGDRIVTRKNHRFTNADGHGAFKVTNGDLLTITDIDPSGDIHVIDTSTRERKTLPKKYVDEHVHLGYAQTVHRAQGATVDVCRAVIDESVNRAGLYVALTRGKHANHAYVVTETALDEQAEDVHYYHQGDRDAPTARDVLSRCIAKDDRQRSATEQLWQSGITDPETLVHRWMAGKDIATQRFIDDHLPTWLDSLPTAWSTEITHAEGGDAPIRQAWRELIRSGVDPRDVMGDAIRHCDGCRSIQHALTYQLRQNVSNRVDELALPPVYAGQDTQLRVWLGHNRKAVREVLHPAPAPVERSKTELGHEVQKARSLMDKLAPVAGARKQQRGTTPPGSSTDTQQAVQNEQGFSPGL
ncbi:MULTISPECIES: MobF family relaxase [Corynebacterium]|uniref:MobF family relaxase n=1 Tax=Corynebacterium TaxID=1716 RepID=UPI00124C4EA6|nr:MULTISPECIES: MobF family relaxase [Corynebacterium]